MAAPSDVPFPGPEHEPFRFGTAPRRVVMVHGFPGTPAEMRALGQRIERHGWEARGILLPGFGPQIGSIGELGRNDWLRAALDAVDHASEGAERVVLLGFSMGAALALAVARRRPALDGVILLAPFHGLEDWRAPFLPVLAPFFPKVKPFEDADFDDPAVRAEISRILPDVDLDDPDVRERIREDIALPTRILNELHALGKEAARAASELDVPAWIVQARGDDTVPVEGARRLATSMSGPITYAEVPGGHDFPVAPDHEGFHEAAAVVVQALDRWARS